MSAGEANTEYLFRRPVETADGETDESAEVAPSDRSSDRLAAPARDPAAFLADCRPRPAFVLAGRRA